MGGTSLSSPLIAAMFALAGGSGGVDYPAETLYRNRHVRPAVLFDPQSGGNSWCGGDNITHCSAFVNSMDVLTRNPNVYEQATVDCSYPLNGERTGTAPRDLECNAAPGLDGPTGLGTPHDLRALQSPLPHVTLSLPPNPKVNHAAPFSASVSDPVSGAHPVRYVWHWGDNRGPTTTTVNHATHTYLSARTYSMYVTVTDSVGQSVNAYGSVHVTR